MTDQTPARITIEAFERLAAEKLPVVAQFGTRAERIIAALWEYVLYNGPSNRTSLRLL